MCSGDFKTTTTQKSHWENLTDDREAGKELMGPASKPLHCQLQGVLFTWGLPSWLSLAFTAHKPKEPREQRTKDLSTGKRKQLFKTWKCARSLVIRSVQRISAKIILHLSDRQRLNYRHTLIPRWSDCIFPTAWQHTFSHKYVPCCWFKTCPRIYPTGVLENLRRGIEIRWNFFLNAEWHVSLWSRQEP